ncbi:unnamed protein product, partial [Cylicostephanus goldi]
SVGVTEQQPSRTIKTVTADPDESLPLPPPPEPPSIPPVSLDDDHGTPGMVLAILNTGAFTHTECVGDTYPCDFSDIIMIPLPPPPPPAISPDAQPSPQPAPDDHVSTQDKNAKRRLTGTARVFSKKSRQDGLLEENPSPPRSPRRGISRSPGPHAPMSPFWKQVNCVMFKMLQP